MSLYAHPRSNGTENEGDAHLLLFEHILNGVPVAHREAFVQRNFPRTYAYVSASLGVFNPLGHARLSNGRTLGAVADE